MPLFLIPVVAKIAGLFIGKSSKIKRLLLALLVAVGLLMGSFVAGYHYKSLKFDRSELKSLQKKLDEAEDQRKIDVENAIKATAKQKEIKYVYKKIKKKAADSLPIATCSDLGTEWGELYNEAARAAKNATR